MGGEAESVGYNPPARSGASLAMTTAWTAAPTPETTSTQQSAPETLGKGLSLRVDHTPGRQIPQARRASSQASSASLSRRGGAWDLVLDAKTHDRDQRGRLAIHARNRNPVRRLVGRHYVLGIWKHIPYTRASPAP